MDPLDKLYQDHHASGNRYDLSLFKSERGIFFRERIGKGKKVLDIGCRDGTLTSTYCQGNDVTGVDIDSKALEHAHATLGIQTMQFNLTETWPIAPHSFDVVVAGEVLEHLYFPADVIARIAHALKTDGMLVGSVPNAFSFKNRVRLFFGRKRYTPLNDPTHINHFSRQEMRDILSRSFKDVRMYPLGRYAKLDAFFPGMFSFMLLFEARSPLGQ